MKAPEIYRAEEIYGWSDFRGDCRCLARPWSEGFRLFRRIALAWLVFTGDADALLWEDEE